MKKSERLNGIVLLLKSKGRLTCIALAEHFEVSERTIYRDIDALSQLKIPIIAFEGAGGGYEISSDYFMPNFKLSKDEILILLMVLKLGDQLKLPNLSTHYSLLKSKIVNALGDAYEEESKYLIDKINFYISRIEPKNYEEDILSVILETLVEDSQVEFMYRAPKDNSVTSRTLSINELFYDIGAWYITGYCHLRKEKRTFRLDRILKIRRIDSPAVILDDLRSETDQFRSTTFRVLMSQSLYRIVKDNEYMNSHVILEEGDVLTIEFTTIFRDIIIQLALSRPQEIQIISPREVIGTIKDTLKILKKYY